MQTNHWLSLRNQSLAVYTREAGFDLAIYDEYSTGVQQELSKRAVRNAMAGLHWGFEDQGVDIYAIKQGIYVISLSSPLTVSYRHKPSQVIYIGMGDIMTRVKQHFEGSLFDFMQSLSGANFDFSFACPSSETYSNYYQHVEWEMLDYWSKQFGGTDERYRFPLLNSIAGSQRDIVDQDTWWQKPLKNTGKRPLWAIKPTRHSDFAALDA